MLGRLMMDRRLRLAVPLLCVCAILVAAVVVVTKEVNVSRNVQTTVKRILWMDLSQTCILISFSETFELFRIQTAFAVVSFQSM